MVEPRIQWLGSGLGHSGSTSKKGASTPGPCAPWRAACPAPRTPIAAASEIPAARLRECLIALLFPRRPVPCWTTPERLYSRHDAADIPNPDDGRGGGGVACR